MASDDKIWVCSSCGGLEFDLDDENVTVVYKGKGSRTALILFEGRAHSLICTTLTKVKRRRELENNALANSNYNLYQKDRDDPEDDLGEENECA